jgi:hypothetical protein
MMKKLMIVTALITTLMGTSVAFAEEKNISFDDAAKMEQMSEQDKQQKGAGAVSLAIRGWQAWQKMSKTQKFGTVIGVGGGASDVYDAGSYAISKFPRGGSYTGGNPSPLTGAGSTMPHR